MQIPKILWQSKQVTDSKELQILWFCYISLKLVLGQSVWNIPRITCYWMKWHQCWLCKPHYWKKMKVSGKNIYVLFLTSVTLVLYIIPGLPIGPSIAHLCKQCCLFLEHYFFTILGIYNWSCKPHLYNYLLTSS